ncbi:HAMP domain-containing histidine kinase [Sphingomonas sp. NBWT7]|uniref:HAMP domain-containing histidine kinase n=1 Tax=Sphingomonas sp. NBWT7 TaxID=2596913 RepID=UPI0016267CFC|nr:HAMP domain-containing histidine kinase [Sphingomonas sp. NBWT7]QNE31458.1 HAMP domain-containing histidine kinase [Sphingomonas sp. NBWT7]
MRFDDSLNTVLAADASTAFGAQATFRQLVDLIARGRAAADAATLDRLRTLRPQVPPAVRAAVARGLALSRPPVGLVALLAEDEPAIAAAALRAARLPAADWIALLPTLGPVGRATLRNRSDLDPVVARGLESFGSTDFTIGFDAPPAADTTSDAPPSAPIDRPVPPPVGTGPFKPVGLLTDALPVVALARRAARTEPVPEPTGFEIADLVDRIATFQRARGTPTPVATPERIDTFRLETDAAGIVSWTDAAPRGAVIGLSIARADGQGAAPVDGIVTGAFRRRTAFTDARLTLPGASAIAGDWRLSAVPMFDPVGGRFLGYRGGGRRPRVDESAVRPSGSGQSEGLRRLVHELRTPTNAIAGFSELIEAQLLGPVAPAYRERAAAIRAQAADLVAAIEDLDLAARIDGHALELRPGVVPVSGLLARAVGELSTLAEVRRCGITLGVVDSQLAFACDDRATERLFARLLATIVSAAQAQEAVALSADRAGDRIAVTISRPRALAALTEDALLRLDAELEADLPGKPLLGTGFALRLIRNLAAELGGTLSFPDGHVRVVLPAASSDAVGQASTN